MNIGNRNNNQAQQANEGIKDPETITLRGLLNLMMKLKISTIISLAGLIVAYSSIVCSIGALVVMKYSGITIEHPFNMRISVASTDMNRKEKGVIDYKIDKLILVKAPWAVTTKDQKKRCYVIFREFGDLDSRKVGQVECLVDKITPIDFIKEKIFGMSKLNFIDDVYAQAFAIGRHANDVHYTQAFVGPSRIRRTYSDGCVLEFQLDNRGQAIAASFGWITYRH